MSELRDPGNEKRRHLAITVGVDYSSKKGFKKEEKIKPGRMTSESDKRMRERVPEVSASGCHRLSRTPCPCWLLVLSGLEKKTEEPSRR